MYMGLKGLTLFPWSSDQANNYYTVAVDIAKFTGRKPYLGGYKHRKTQQLFHHASTQVSSPYRLSLWLMAELTMHVYGSIRRSSREHSGSRGLCERIARPRRRSS